MNDREKLLAEAPIGKVLYQLALPGTIGMMFNALYNLVDTIFVGQGVGGEAIGGLTVSFPIQMFIMAIAMMIGTGGASAISRSLGAKAYDRARKLTGNAYALVLVFSILAVVLGTLFIEPILRIFGATDTLLPFAKEYMSIIFLGSVFFSFLVAANNLVRAEGNAKIAMVAMVIGTGMNIVLDPIFIFWLDMGIAGAAWATIISQFLAFLFIIRYLFGHSTALRIHLSDLILEPALVKEIISIGFPAFARQVGGSALAIVLNNSLVYYGGDIALSTFGIINRVMMFLFMPMFGVVHGFQPIAGYSYGAKAYGRLKEVVYKSIMVITILASISWVTIELFPGFFMRLFVKDLEIIALGTQAMRWIFLVIPIIGVQIISASFYQAIGRAKPGLFLSLLRQFIILIPLLFIMPRIGGLGLMGLWLAMPLSDLLSTGISAVMLKSDMKKILVESN